MKNTLFVILVSFLSGLGGAYFYSQLNSEAGKNDEFVFASNDSAGSNPQFTSAEELPSTQKSVLPNLNVDFRVASEKTTESVVYIKTMVRGRSNGSFYEWFFGSGSPSLRVGSGSGVIYTSDGYIITNNHVIEGADEIEVMAKERSYKAQIIGTDPSTDIAVLKIEAKGLPAIELGSSRDVAVGEWVLAVGNPFNLTSTVTAGIVSAKGRSINILKGNFPIESFIQTDAAINPGNSGGALVNANGELIGINTAILSKTGSYAGYGFAVPIDIAKKVVNDLINYREVQKAFIGASVIDITYENREYSPDGSTNGVLITRLNSDGAAEKAGLKEGDLIYKINDIPVPNKIAYDETLGYYSPGEKITIFVKRNDENLSRQLTLTNALGTTSIIKRELYSSERLGADFVSLSPDELKAYDIKGGIRIKNVKPGLIERMDLSEEFIITKVNGEVINSAEELADLLQNARGRVVVEGINQRGVKGYFSYLF
ncbi:trypsin-like peptidase domain-containing protein [Marinigracilibium pacificum]|uniref:PDZ domain-containing protein n=1 Tax=Marinigracilibium pacificum TaxID=2729599 RepID=A0A848J0Z9_9BACT|nr:trypsin-like peptidase domain-containing protein [Marinigracilibium pacificum]NMM49486.1 PDZ domain-containing protein [Marinigracilibium pacificum]